MRLVYTATAVRGLKAMPTAERAALQQKLAAIATAPFAMHPYAKRLVGENGFRCRQGTWRALYVVDRSTDTVTVTDVRHRREVYR